MEAPSGPDRETTLLLVAFGCLMGLLGEVVSYFIVYSNEDFKRLHKDILKLWREYYSEILRYCSLLLMFFVATVAFFFLFLLFFLVMDLFHALLVLYWCGCRWCRCC